MGVLFINKPKGYTSFDVCKKFKRILNTKKIGHTGTLDPNATGVMIILYDKDVKGDQFIVGHDKTYIGTCLIGKRSDTLDIDGNIIEEKNVNMPLKKDIEEAMQSLVGKQLQYPPMTSAVKVKGKRLYEYQREGIEVEIKPRAIEVKSFELLELNNLEFKFKCHVTSGTYIRVLLQDLLNKLNCIGLLKDLQRTKLGIVDISECDELEAVIDGKYEKHSLYEILSKYYETIEMDNIDDVIYGKKIKLDAKEDIVLISHNKECIAIYEKKDDVYVSKRGLF